MKESSQGHVLEPEYQKAIDRCHQGEICADELQMLKKQLQFVNIEKDKIFSKCKDLEVINKF